MIRVQRDDLYIIDLKSFGLNDLQKKYDFLFIFNKCLDEKVLIFHLNKWNIKYNNPGLIFTSEGFFINLHLINFEIKFTGNIVKDLYYQTVLKDIKVIPNEIFNYNIFR